MFPIKYQQTQLTIQYTTRTQGGHPTLNCSRVYLLGALVRMVTDCGFLHSSTNVNFCSPCVRRDKHSQRNEERQDSEKMPLNHICLFPDPSSKAEPTTPIKTHHHYNRPQIKTPQDSPPPSSSSCSPHSRMPAGFPYPTPTPPPQGSLPTKPMAIPFTLSFLDPPLLSTIPLQATQQSPGQAFSIVPVLDNTSVSTILMKTCNVRPFSALDYKITPLIPASSLTSTSFLLLTLPCSPAPPPPPPRSPETHQHVLVHHTGVPEALLSHVVQAVHGHAAASQRQTLHVTALGAAQRDDTGARQHVERHRVDS